MKKPYLLLLYLVCISFHSLAGGLEGKITGKDSEGKLVPLSFATVYVEELQSGTSTNVEGFYRIDLPAGEYHLKFQYLGYQTVEKNLKIGSEFTRLDIQMEGAAIELEETVITGVREDPSYTVIRKAIAKADYHLKQLDSYTARVYVKGSGRLKDVPFFFQKSMKKEGLDSNMAFNTESIIDVRYERPNNYHQKVISMRSSGFMNENSPIDFVFGSFYNESINGAVSPLSKNAFSFYRFELIETFVDNGNTINKIRVTPRARGENVFTGFIYILEDLWSIYSLDLQTTQMGFTTDIQQNYVELKDNVWMPITYQFEVSGKVFGFDFEFDYLTTISDYQLDLNEDLPEFVLVDAIVQKDFENNISKKEIKNGEISIKEVENKKLSRRDLVKLMEKYEEEQFEQKKKEGTEDILYTSNMEIDSLASKKDSTYWDSIRPVPLTEYEVKANTVLDSMQKAEEAERKKDSLKNNDGFHPEDILLGGQYKLNKYDRLNIGIPAELSLFNTVDGFQLGYRIRYINAFEKNQNIGISPEAKYNFKRESFNGKIGIAYDKQDKNLNSFSIGASAGRMESQFNSREPISPFINLLTTFLLERNYMKIYEKDFASISLGKSFKGKFHIQIDAEYARRRSLRNHSTATLVDIKNREYSSNTPVSIEMPNTNFPEHYAFTSKFELRYSPWMKYRIIDKDLQLIRNSSPEFRLSYYTGKKLLDSRLDFDRIEIGMEHTFALPAARSIDLEINAGKFIRSEKIYFPDYKHFMGNESPLAMMQPVGNFRLLDYYALSTKEEYASVFFHYRFRKLLLTQILPIRMLGLQENLFVNQLYTPSSENYTEIGYGLDNIFRFLRVEAVANFKSMEFSTFGLRLGISTSLLGN